jgi:aconitate hydratase
MGVLPLQFEPGQTAAALGLTGSESFDILLTDDLKPRQPVSITATTSDGRKIQFTVICRIDTPVEIEYYRNGGILHTVLRKMLFGAS